MIDFIAVLATEVNSLYISSWIPIQAQGTSPVIITHPLGHIPAKVDVQVKVHENGSEYIFPASGSAQRDDDSDNVYGGVVYIYNEFHVKIYVPSGMKTPTKEWSSTQVQYVRHESAYKDVYIGSCEIRLFKMWKSCMNILLFRYGVCYNSHAVVMKWLRFL